MALLRPLAPDSTTGVPKQIASPDTIDPAILPASSSATPTSITGGSFTVASNTQMLFFAPLILDDSFIVDGTAVFL